MPCCVESNQWCSDEMKQNNLFIIFNHCYTPSLCYSSVKNAPADRGYEFPYLLTGV